MAYAMKELACDPTRIKGMSEKLIVSHYENNYGGAVNRLNAITAQLADLDFAKAPGFVINGLKREELIASNSMILHELFFGSLGDESAPEGELRDALAPDFGIVDRCPVLHQPQSPISPRARSRAPVQTPAADPGLPASQRRAAAPTGRMLAAPVVHPCDTRADRR